MGMREYEDVLQKWVEDAPEMEALSAEGVLMWGVWFNLNDETAEPVAAFREKGKAEGFAALCGEPEWHVGPCVMSIKTRNSVDLPERK